MCDCIDILVFGVRDESGVEQCCICVRVCKRRKCLNVAWGGTLHAWLKQDIASSVSRLQLCVYVCMCSVCETRMPFVLHEEAPMIHDWDYLDLYTLPMK